MGKKKSEPRPAPRAPALRPHTCMAPPNHICGELANLRTGEHGDVTPVIIVDYTDVLSRPATYYTRLDPVLLQTELLNHPELQAAADKAHRQKKLPVISEDLRKAAATAVDVTLVNARTHLREHLDLLVEFALVQLCRNAEQAEEDQTRRQRLAAQRKGTKSDD